MTSPERTAILLVLGAALAGCAGPDTPPGDPGRPTIRPASGDYEGFDLVSTPLDEPTEPPPLDVPPLPGSGEPPAEPGDRLAGAVASLTAPGGASGATGGPAPAGPADAAAPPVTGPAVPPPGERLVPSTSVTRVLPEDERAAVLDAARRARERYRSILRQRTGADPTVTAAGEPVPTALPPATVTPPPATATTMPPAVTTDAPSAATTTPSTTTGPAAATTASGTITPVPLTPLRPTAARSGSDTAPAPRAADAPPRTTAVPLTSLTPGPQDAGRAPLEPRPGPMGRVVPRESAAVAPDPDTRPSRARSDGGAPSLPSRGSDDAGVPRLVSPATPLPAGGAPAGLVPAPVEYRRPAAPRLEPPPSREAPEPVASRPERPASSLRVARETPAPAPTSTLGAGSWEPALPAVTVPPARGAGAPPSGAGARLALPEPVTYDVRAEHPTLAPRSARRPATTPAPTAASSHTRPRASAATPSVSPTPTPSARHPELPNVVVPPLLGSGARPFERETGTRGPSSTTGTTTTTTADPGAVTPAGPAPTTTADRGEPAGGFAPTPLGGAEPRPTTPERPTAAPPTPLPSLDAGPATRPSGVTYGASNRARSARLAASLEALGDEVRPQAEQIKTALEAAFARLTPPEVLATTEVGLRDWGDEAKLGYQKSVDALYDEAIARLEALYDYAVTTARARASEMSASASALDEGPSGDASLDGVVASFEEVLRQELGIGELRIRRDQRRGLETTLAQTFSTFGEGEAEATLGGRLLLYVGRHVITDEPRCVVVFRDDEGRDLEDLSIAQAVRHRVLRGEALAYDLGWRPDPARRRPGRPATLRRGDYLLATSVEPRVNREAPSFDDLRDMRVVVDMQTAVLAGPRPGGRELLGGVDWRVIFEISRLGDVTWDLGGRPVFDPWCSEVVREIEGGSP